MLHIDVCLQLHLKYMSRVFIDDHEYMCDICSAIIIYVHACAHVCACIGIFTSSAPCDPLCPPG